MANQFDDLRKLARDKRDDAIRAARDAYCQEMAEINALQKKLVAPKPSLKGKPKPAVPLRARIMDVAPTDSHFTVADIGRRLSLPESDLVLVRTTFDRLIKRGEMKRVRRGRNNSPAVFAVAGYGPPVSPFNDLAQIEAAELVLRELGRPVELTVLVVELLERGYVPVSDEKLLRKSLGAAMGRKLQFTQERGLWSAR